MKAKTLSSELPSEVESLVRETVSRITTSGGRVVGAIGFSQGTRVVAGLLRGVQIKARTGARSEDWMASFAFGLCVCGSHPLPLVPAGVLGCPEVVALGDVKRDEVLQEKIAMPMLHVQGSRDVGKSMEDELIQVHFEVANGCSEVVEWDMGHHYPMRVKESEKMRDWLVCQLERVDAEREIGV
ncbi:hypothetical protein B0O99DRAFT_644931 [Bisporella sp. PMI_857]|nr:hypothetical protein B0O99DRAFT_644931 [Bisporella sp. PMI_857]